jgi:hypothetical protein
MPKKKPMEGKPEVHEELAGFEMRINEFGEIVTNTSVDKLNRFLNAHVEDKKFKDLVNIPYAQKSDDDDDDDFEEEDDDFDAEEDLDFDTEDDDEIADLVKNMEKDFTKKSPKKKGDDDFDSFNDEELIDEYGEEFGEEDDYNFDDDL